MNEPAQVLLNHHVWVDLSDERSFGGKCVAYGAIGISVVQTADDTEELWFFPWTNVVRVSRKWDRSAT